MEAGRTAKDVCREYEISEATYYQWKSKYGGMEAADIRRLRELEDENRLKQIHADLSLENRALKDVIAKSSEASREARTGCGLTTRARVERSSTAAVGLERSVYHYQPRPNADGPIVKS